MVQMITKRKDRMVESVDMKFEKPEQKKADQLQVARKDLEMVKQDLKALSPPPRVPVTAPKPAVAEKRKNSSPSTRSASKFLQKLKERVLNTSFGHLENNSHPTKWSLSVNDSS